MSFSWYLRVLQHWVQVPWNSRSRTTLLSNFSKNLQCDRDSYFDSAQLTEKFFHRGLLNMFIRIAVKDASSILTYLYTCWGESPYGGIPCWPIKGSFVSTCITPALWITHTPSNTDIVVGSILWFGRHALFNFDYWAPLMLIWILCIQ